MKYGFWLPVFGGWLRNVEDENMPATFDYVKKVAQNAENLGYDMTLIAELNLNDIKGMEAPTLDAWTTTAAIAAVTNKLEILTAIRPGFYNPALFAKTAANIDHISGGRLSLNVVSAWWEEEAHQYGGVFTAHDERYARTEEFLEVLKGLWTQTPYSYKGKFYEYKNTYLSPKPIRDQHIPLYAGGESEAGKQTIAETCDSYVMHGGTIEEVQEKIEDMRNRRLQLGKVPFDTFGMSAYIVCRDTEEEVQAELARIQNIQEDSPGYAGYQDFISKSQLNVKVSLEDYSVSNRGLRPNLIGTPEQIAKRILAYEEVGVNLLILQFSPQLEEMQRFSEKVMPIVEQLRSQKLGAK
ncbi:LLM class flavin-dependent oxidoreductase [Psychrobacillus sp. OK032]|uniref:LLM class flavin-dependent oxidoreductase n=1 Tax=Psychrobacillus sp. OK032 TaxID=1884358 RepID=UPI0008BC962A|nr:LLM class flavin-dependent oxidoreductase [Psychrobacillus sp. OK032]SES25644.1 FMNH2-dependent dimethyl sulfone monooxygenase [Psychrobacillus sp. OK032]